MINNFFRLFSQRVSSIVGSPWAFLFAIAMILAWFVIGPLFHFSDTWQLVMNTITSIITFLMVFLIQNTQNRDSKAIHLKLDELIRTTHNARNSLVDLEDMTDDQIEELARQFQHFREQHAKDHGALVGPDADLPGE